MKSPAHDIALHLATNGIGTFGGAASWSINVAREPPTPDDAITIYDTPGGEPDTDELDLLRPTFQVRARSLDYTSAFVKHEAIRDLLILPGKVVTVNSTFIEIDLSSDINAIGVDDNNRHIVVANYRAIRERA